MSSSSTPAASAEDIAKHGWTAVPRDANTIFGEKPFIHEPTALSVDEIPFPKDDPLVVKVQEYVKHQLAAPTYNHSMRVYYFGTGRQFPPLSDNTFPDILAQATSY